MTRAGRERGMAGCVLAALFGLEVSDIWDAAWNDEATKLRDILGRWRN
jgi:hypothetical protein